MQNFTPRHHERAAELPSSKVNNNLKNQTEIKFRANIPRTFAILKIH